MIIVAFLKIKNMQTAYLFVLRDQISIFDTLINSVEELNASSELDLYFQMESHQIFKVEWGKQALEHLCFFFFLLK